MRLAALGALCVVAAGCGGITASKSISPIDFLLPGLLQADPPPAQPERVLPADEPGKLIARS